MDEIALPFEESVDVIGEITRNLRHPQSIRPASDSANLNAARRQLHKEKDDEPLQATKCSLYPSISPSLILFCHPHNQRRDFLSRSPSSTCSKRTAIILLRNP